MQEQNVGKLDKDFERNNTSKLKASNNKTKLQTGKVKGISVIRLPIPKLKCGPRLLPSQSH